MSLLRAGPPRRTRYDVVVAGGGLAGLCLAIQLKRNEPNLAVVVVEKSEHPRPEAAHKVGESSVEIASHYFLDTLDLGGVLGRELKKFGLRFFMKNGDNAEISTRLECGPSHFLSVPSFQIDRGQFENALAHRARGAGVEFVDGWRVGAPDLAPGNGDHRVELSRNGERAIVACRWLVDGTGRAALLKKKLGLGRPNRHRVNAAWFRLDAAIEPDRWSSDPVWRARVEAPRRQSTNHLMGSGYWVWLIPLAHERTSVGIVADDHLHPFEKLSNFEKALSWLERHEPQCARVVRAHREQRMDFRAIKNYSHDAGAVFSAERWCLTGDAGVFVDPLYSPGSDFVAIANGYCVDLITRDLHGEEVGALAEQYNQAYRSLCRTFLVTYHRQYPLMGNPRVMTLKVVWDFLMYWGGVALIFYRGKLLDLDFMNRIRPQLGGFAAANVRMQAFFREWHGVCADDPPLPVGAFVDYAEISFLARLNRELLVGCDDESLVARLDQNLRLALELQREIHAEASRSNAKLRRPVEPPATAHLADVFRHLAPRDARARRTRGVSV